ncbi:MAG: mechanosensitive ion channel [Anaerolineae bacterium]|nr:mechanosensitive ion channel [Anaerolineae bacterium]
MDPRPGLEALATFILTQAIPAIFGAALLILGGSFGISLILKIVTATARRSRVKQALIDLLSAAITAAGWILIIAGVLQTLGLNSIAIAVGGSISLVALGIASAAAGNLGDIIAGIFLASDPDFGTGFTITSDKVTGTIERIDLRKTRIRAPDGKLHIVPNKDIESKVWIVEARANEPPPLNFRIPTPNLPNLPNIPNLRRGQQGSAPASQGGEPPNPPNLPR